MSHEPRFALVHDWLTIPGGSENCFEQICDMFPGVVFTSQANVERIAFLQKYEVRTSFIQRMPLAFKKHYLYAPVAPRAFRSFDLSEFDVVLVDSHSFAHHIQPSAQALFFAYYHTPARALWAPEVDLRAGGRFGWLKRPLANRLRALDYAAGQRPHVRYANSQTTKERLERAYGVKVDGVIYPPVDVAKFLDVRRISDEEGLLMWGRLIPYKRFDLAIKAAKITGERLNIVGSGPEEAALKRQALGAGNIVFHGRLGDDELKKLMARSRAVLFPNYEDFGIIPVEAMAAGVPVVAYGHGGATESVTPETGVLFPDATPDSLVDAIRGLGEFDPTTLRERSRRFDVARFRTDYRAAVERAITRHFG